MSFAITFFKEVTAKTSAVANHIVYNAANPSPPAEAVTKAGMGYSDYLSVTLTAVTVILAVLALVVGVLAIWGYTQFKEMTRKASKEHLENLINDGSFKAPLEELIFKYMTEQLKDGDLRQIISERVDRVLMTDASNRSNAQAASADDAEAPFEN